jgi:hypothetical protein
MQHYTITKEDIEQIVDLFIEELKKDPKIDPETIPIILDHYLNGVTLYECMRRYDKRRGNLVQGYKNNGILQKVFFRCKTKFREDKCL